MSHPSLSRSRRGLLVGVVTVAVSMTAWFSPLPAAADGTTLDLNGLDDPVVLDYTGDAFEVTLPQGQDGLQTGSQCIDDVAGSTDPTKACIGTATATDQPPLTFGGLGDVSPLIKSEKATGPLGWIVADAIQAVRVAHDIPDDSRIERYARGEIRAQILDTLLSIMDKKVYGVPLTADESSALTWVEGQFLERDRLLAQKAVDEYSIFTSSPCTYRPPATPAIVTKPEVLPKSVTSWCRINSQLASQVSIAPPLPTAAQFTTWASYRYADELGLTAFADPAVTKSMVGIALGVTTFAAFAVAAAVGAVTYYATLATGAAASIGAKLFPYAARTFFRQGATALMKIFARIAADASSAVAGAIAAAFIAAVVVVALVVIGVATYFVVQHANVLSALKKVYSEALDSSDPFGLEPLRKKLSGQPLNSNLDTEVPGYRQAPQYNQLAAQVALWTTVADDGTVVPDPSGIWSNSDPGPGDPRWVVRVGDQEPVLRDRVQVPQYDAAGKRVYPFVSVSQGWFVVTEPDRPARPALSFGYVDENDEARVAQRAPRSVGGFLVTDTDEATSGRVANLTFLDEKGRLVRARLQATAPSYLAGPRPTAVGPMWAGRPVLLRPNPVGTNGASLDITQVQDDYDFDWTVQRLDAQTGTWTDVTVPDDYGTSFLPTTPGEYDARVTMTSIDDASQRSYGSVRFTVSPPPVTAPVLILQDDGEKQLELDLQLQEEVPGDSFTVEVTWPGSFGAGSGQVTTLELPCVRTDVLQCTSQRTGPSDLLTRTLPDDVDLSRPVQVLVTNSTGGVLKQELQLGEGRPSLEAPAEGTNSDEPGAAYLDGRTLQVEMPLDDTAGVQDYTVARLVPSAGTFQQFNLLDPETGNTTGAVKLPGSRNIYAQVFPENGSWYLELFGTPQPRDLGTYELPLVIGQTNSTSTTALAVVQVVPSIDGRQRAALLTDVDPDASTTPVPPLLQPTILGGIADQPRYRGGLCVSLRESAVSPDAVTQCRPAADWVGSDGKAAPFPFAELFPRGMDSGSYEARAWLTAASDTVDTRPLSVGFFLSQDASYPRPQVTLGAVGVQGKAKVGRTLRAGYESLRPATATLSYTWLRDGKAIKGAHASSYRLKRADKGHRIAVTVVARLSRWTPATGTSPRTGVVR